MTTTVGSIFTSRTTNQTYFIATTGTVRLQRPRRQLGWAVNSGAVAPAFSTMIEMVIWIFMSLTIWNTPWAKTLTAGNGERGIDSTATSGCLMELQTNCTGTTAMAPSKMFQWPRASPMLRGKGWAWHLEILTKMAMPTSTSPMIQSRDFLYRNNGDGTFSDLTYSAGVGYDSHGKPQAGMGVDCGDVDGDGALDIFVTNFARELNALYQNRGGLLFQEVSEKLGLASGFKPLGFGTKIFDFDNDGDLDIYVANGHIEDNVKLYYPDLLYAQNDLLYENRGGQFKDVSAISGFEAQHVGRGAAVGDFDNDGDLDIVVSNSGARPILMENVGGNKNSWIAIRARGSRSNFFGLGVRVRVETSAGSQLKEINNVASYLSSNDTRLYFGLGLEKTVKSIEISWPSGPKPDAPEGNGESDSTCRGTLTRGIVESQRADTLGRATN